jgi:hypothetical protein
MAVIFGPDPVSRLLHDPRQEMSDTVAVQTPDNQYGTNSVFRYRVAESTRIKSDYAGTRNSMLANFQQHGVSPVPVDDTDAFIQ